MSCTNCALRFFHIYLLHTWIHLCVLAPPTEPTLRADLAVRLQRDAALRVPFERLSRGFRNNQKLLEREISSIVSDIEALSACGEDAGKHLQRLLTQLTKLKEEVCSPGSLCHQPMPPVITTASASSEC
jgi:hypothetical protein